MLLERWRLAHQGVGGSTTQWARVVLLPPLSSALLAVVACAWEFQASSSAGWRRCVLLLPQLALLLSLVLALSFKRRIRPVALATVFLLPLGVLALLHSGFRLGLALCCCSPDFCPVTLRDSRPDTAACGRVVSNCYMAFIRKMAHFYGTTGMLGPIARLAFAVLAIVTRQRAGRRHCQRFLAKTRPH